MPILLIPKPTRNLYLDRNHYLTAICLIGQAKNNAAPHWARLKQSILHCRMHLALLATCDTCSMRCKWLLMIQSWCASTTLREKIGVRVVVIWSKSGLSIFALTFSKSVLKMGLLLYIMSLPKRTFADCFNTSLGKIAFKDLRSNIRVLLIDENSRGEWQNMEDWNN